MDLDDFLAPHPSFLLESDGARRDLMNRLDKLGWAVTPSFLEVADVERLRNTISRTMASSKPQWKPISRKTANFWWINDNNPLSTVQGAFAQVNFFPWDNDSKEIYTLLGGVLRVRNLLLGQSADAFFNPSEQDDITVRVAAQFYPANYGWMQEHKDPVGPHQTVLASLVMSKYGEDYREGGLFSRQDSSEKQFPESFLEVGDLIWFVPTINHGVDKIVGMNGTEFKGWSNFSDGRWMVLMASNSLSPSATIARATAVSEP